MPGPDELQELELEELEEDELVRELEPSPDGVWRERRQPRSVRDLLAAVAWVPIVGFVAWVAIALGDPGAERRARPVEGRLYLVEEE